MTLNDIPNDIQTVTEIFYEETHEIRDKATETPQELVHTQMDHSKYEASNATREIDNLMASLYEFKDKNIISKEFKFETERSCRTYTTPLEPMITDVKDEKIKPKADCFACQKPIFDKVVTALGKTWHTECFRCANCGIELADRNFYERDDKPFCEKCYIDLFAPKCALCNQPIIDKFVKALDKTWHPQCFCCCICGKQLGEEGFHEKDGKPYCKDHFFNLHAPKCAACNNPITEDVICALDKQWHPECFVCAECHCPFSGGDFFDYDGKPYCEIHYHAKRGSLCAGCYKPIFGRCVTAMFRKFHPQHFVCSFCQQQLNKSTFKEQNDKPYCHACFDKLFG